MINKKTTCLTGTLAALLAFVGAGTVFGDVMDVDGRIRDFSSAHPDMELDDFTGEEPGIATPFLGGDGKPVFSGGSFLSVDSEASFNQWFRDTAGVNLGADIAFTLDNTLTANPHIYRYSNFDFFPIDDAMWGNEIYDHNYHFTYELHTVGEYQPGDVLEFASDDDLFVYINGQQYVDIGGVHKWKSRTVSMDTVASDLGLAPGDMFDYELFYAERRTSQAVLKFDIPIPAPSALCLLATGGLFIGFPRRRR